MEFNCTDTGSAERFIHVHDGNVKYIDEEKRWIVFKHPEWDAAHRKVLKHGGWKPAKLFTLTKLAVLDIYRETSKDDQSDNDRVELGQWAKKSESRAYQRS